VSSQRELGDWFVPEGLVIIIILLLSLFEGKEAESEIRPREGF
jgi:hypothetical protein